MGDYLHRDLEAGRLTLDEAQELMDCFFLKMADLFLSGPMMFLRVVGAYSNNHRITIAGRKPDGSDATNEATYLCLQSAARLQLHDPNLSLALHEDSPLDLWEAGIETAKRVGGVPTLDNADLVASLLHNRGLSWEDARNFCVVGCVEYSGSGCEYANASGPFSKSFINLNNTLLAAINNGVNPQTGKAGGLETGYLYEMQTFDDVKAAFKKQLEYFLDWYLALNTISEYVGIREMPVPVASATIDGCMESGHDMMWGGAKYNSTGVATMGVGTLVDSLSTIKYMVYDKKLCSAQQLYDAVMANWKGHELLRQRILNEVPHYGNGDAYADELATLGARGLLGQGQLPGGSAGPAPGRPLLRGRQRPLWVHDLGDSQRPAQRRATVGRRLALARHREERPDGRHAVDPLARPEPVRQRAAVQHEVPPVEHGRQ